MYVSRNLIKTTQKIYRYYMINLINSIKLKKILKIQFFCILTVFESCLDFDDDCVFVFHKKIVLTFFLEMLIIVKKK